MVNKIPKLYWSSHIFPFKYENKDTLLNSFEATQVIGSNSAVLLVLRGVVEGSRLGRLAPFGTMKRVLGGSAPFQLS